MFRCVRRTTAHCFDEKKRGMRKNAKPDSWLKDFPPWMRMIFSRSGNATGKRQNSGFCENQCPLLTWTDTLSSRTFRLEHSSLSKTQDSSVPKKRQRLSGTQCAFSKDKFLRSAQKFRFSRHGMSFWREFQFSGESWPALSKNSVNNYSHR